MMCKSGGEGGEMNMEEVKAKLKADEKLTAGDVCDAAVQIESQEEADEFLEILVQLTMASKSMSHEAALKRQRRNLAFWAGYHGEEARRRVERLFKCAHPVFGAIAEKGSPTAEEALEMGKKLGREMRN